MPKITNGADDAPQKPYEYWLPPFVPPPNRALQRPEILQILRQITLDAEASLRAVCRSELRIDSALQYLNALVASLAKHCPTVQMTPEPKWKPLGAKAASLKHAGAAWSSPEKTTQGGVEDLKIEWLPTGAALVRVNGGNPFKLPRTLGHLLQIISQDGRPTDDGLVGWKSFKDVADAMTAELGRNFSKRAINQLVYRLRRELFARGGLNQSLVHCHSQLGLRFALKHKAKL